ncbi:aminotransferase class V-fold PLP-dependent enzyme [uncultured Devosia sp.]|nr:aminotransferase class V-fold PLP-dependent enzyme [uncultured Devosia sp.]
MRLQEEILLAPLMEFLRQKNNVRLIGPTDPSKRAPTVSLALGELAVEAADRLARRKIMASGGHFYAYRLLEALGLNPGHGVLRVSFTHYTSPAEVQRLIEALDAELK